jgi:integrase
MISLNVALLAVKQEQTPDYAGMRKYIESNFPHTVKALRLVDLDNTTARRGKGYGLVKRESKRHGFLYYVRYCHNGKMLPSKWNTHTNNLEEAEAFAKKNRDRLVGGYLKARKTPIYALLEKYFAEDSPYLVSEKKRNRVIVESSRVDYHRKIIGKFIPFLKENNIRTFDQVTVQRLIDFQDWLLDGDTKLKPQSVNCVFKPIKKIFIYLHRKGVIKDNPCRNLERLAVHQSDMEARGCYDVEKIKGIFNKEWDDNRNYLLCLLIYTTGMRDCEIRQIRKCDIVSIGGCHFVDVKRSKTENGVRLVPLHEFVYDKLMAYAQGEDDDALLFRLGYNKFGEANAELARHLGVSKEYLEAENITFYSGRHFWKTLMNSKNLGADVEELFMGHKVSNDVAKLYNHRDKQGKDRMVAKAKKIFTILDKKVFA